MGSGPWKVMTLLLAFVGGVARASAASKTARPDGLRVEPVALAAPDGSRFPRLVTDPRGGAWLLYLVAGEGAAPRLELCRNQGGKFGDPIIVAEGGDWFVNWADFPTLAADADGSLAVCWLEKIDRGTFAYGIRVRTSPDRGTSWGVPFWLHDDVSAAEHGFPSLIAEGRGAFRAVWLDGRDMGRTGSMTLRTRRFLVDGTREPERLLDERVCECCTTGLAPLEGGWLTVYRDRTEQEVRDIEVLTAHDGEVTAPGRVFADDWIIPG